jgi:hypothetical protein
MKRQRKSLMIPTRIRLLVVLLCALVPLAASAADVITVGTVTASGTTVDVPVSIRDNAGTTLGVDQPAGSRIQSFSIKVSYAPASAISSVTFTRAGITAGLTPTSEFAPSSAGAISLLDTFKESTNPIPFTLNAGAPGDRVAHLVFTLAASATPGTQITLALDPSLTQLTDEGGNAATKETTANGRLTLVDGSITVPQPTISLSPSTATVRLNNTTTVQATLSLALASPVTVTVTSSATSIATVPATVQIAAGARTADITVSPKAVGTTDVTASITGSSSVSHVTVLPASVACSIPSAPQISGPFAAEGGTAYTISWPTVTGATSYLVDESTDELFSAPTTQTITETSATFTHAGDVHYYYRVRARSQSGTCDVTSNASNVVAVFVSNAPLPQMRILAVVGSTPGAFGSYFKTSVQLYNPKSTTLSGKVVFHTQFASGSSTDPSLAYSIAPGKTVVYPDLLPALNVTSGLGSVDIIGDIGVALPVSLVRVFNDAGAAGTTGFAEEQLAPAEALQPGSIGVLLTPSDVARFRLNVGVRTLDQGATMTITVRDKDGVTVATVNRTYAATYFAQVGSPALLDGYALKGGETITFEVTSGGAFVYGSTTDNTTNDPSVQFARRIE